MVTAAHEDGFNIEDDHQCIATPLPVGWHSRLGIRPHLYRALRQLEANFNRSGLGLTPTASNTSNSRTSQRDYQDPPDRDQIRSSVTSITSALTVPQRDYRDPSNGNNFRASILSIAVGDMVPQSRRNNRHRYSIFSIPNAVMVRNPLNHADFIRFRRFSSSANITSKLFKKYCKVVCGLLLLLTVLGGTGLLISYANGTYRLNVALFTGITGPLLLLALFFLLLPERWLKRIFKEPHSQIVQMTRDGLNRSQQGTGNATWDIEMQPVSVPPPPTVTPPLITPQSALYARHTPQELFVDNTPRLPRRASLYVRSVSPHANTLLQFGGRVRSPPPPAPAYGTAPSNFFTENTVGLNVLTDINRSHDVTPGVSGLRTTPETTDEPMHSESLPTNNNHMSVVIPHIDSVIRVPSLDTTARPIPNYTGDGHPDWQARLNEVRARAVVFNVSRFFDGISSSSDRGERDSFEAAPSGSEPQRSRLPPMFGGPAETRMFTGLEESVERMHRGSAENLRDRTQEWLKSQKEKRDGSASEILQTEVARNEGVPEEVILLSDGVVLGWDAFWLF
ncbi:hypothetical protein M501DRAFT_1012698 [Patellaria atrata CBS 101060]|uniref:Uncharacterized protein n=1 Tax=Patellaria atrata CBS 101060 TaxID=1346257 RepID=A0A9P4VTN4_9PEZI|nr:hypothetical protein M501DRAFT_1012698 [Patellaria atrata CBS 101060]